MQVAETLLVKVLTFDNTPANKETKAYAHRLLAKIYGSQSRKSEQIHQLFSSYWLFKETSHAEESEALRLIGKYYLQMKLYGKAKEFLDQALDMAEVAKDTLTSIQVISNQGQLAYSKNQLANSIELFEQSIFLSEQQNYKTGLRENWSRLSYAYWQKGDPQRMLGCVKEAVKYKTLNTDTLAILYDDLGFAYYINKSPDSANHYLNMALNLINKGKNIQQKISILKHLGEVQKQQKQYEQYTTTLEEQLRLRDDAFTEQLTGAITNAELHFNELDSTLQVKQIESNRKELLIALTLAIVTLGILIVFILWLRRNNRYIKARKQELKVANKKLTHSEKLYRQLFENSLGLICTHTPAGKVITVNKAYEDILKVPRKFLRGKSIGELLPSKYENFFPDYLREVTEKGETEGWIKVLNGEGNELVLRYQNRMIVPENAEPFIISFAQDQTEIFRTRVQADEERRRLQTVMKNSPDIFSILQPDGVIKYMNRSNFFNVKEVVGKSVMQLLSSEEGTAFYMNLKKTCDTAIPHQAETAFKDRHYLTKLIPIMKDNLVKEVLSINTDVTEIKRAQIDLKKAKEEAEESNRLKTIFLGSLSHEVRTPLQGILWMAELLERPSITDVKRAEFLKLIKRRTFDMQNIIESLLDMASLETGEIKSFPVEVELYELAGSVFAKIKEDYFSDIPSDIQINFENQLTKPTLILIDPVHFNQVILNLFRNAVKFTNQGSITIKCMLQPGAYLFEVTDTGIGIPEDKLEHIFKPFRQAHEGLSRTKGGIGLGLAICKKMVEMWNGHLKVESQPGMGSTFTFTIPVSC